MALITRSNHPSALWPGIKSWFGNSYKEWRPIYSQIFDVQSSDKAYEEIVEATGFGMAPVKSEGASVYYDADSEGYKSRFTHVAYALGYIVTREEMDDGQYTDVSSRRSKALQFSMKATKETVHANVLNRAFSTSFNGGDGVPLISDSHPTRGGLQSNRITDADLSESSIEDMFKSIWAAKNSNGLPIVLKGTTLIVHPSELFNAERIFASALRPGTANNDANAIRSMELVPTVVADPYLTDLDAFFLKTDTPDGLISFDRVGIELAKDKDFDTDNAKAKAYERYSAGWGDWRGVWGSQGA